MPVLHQRKEDGGYYVRAILPGTSTIATWQITPEGVNIIRARGYLGVDVDFPPRLLKELIDRGHAYTHGLGISAAPPLHVTRADPSVARPAASARALSLVFFEEGATWKLAVRVAEIPRAWAESADNLVDALSGWQIRIEGIPPVPATRLWPGRGGALIAVMPQHQAYEVTPQGRWPDAWDVPAWLGLVPGLGPEATLFSGDDGERLDPGATVEPGGTYIFVAPDNRAARRGHRRPPAFLAPEYLGRSGAWQAWSIQLPESVDEQVRGWCTAIGYRLAEPRFRLALITPPQGYTKTGLPIIAVGEDVVLGLMSAGPSPVGEARCTFYTTCFQEPGTFRIATDGTSAAELHVVAERQPLAVDTRHPPALRIELKWGSHKVTWHAFRDGVGPHEFRSPQSARQGLATITVHCAVPLSVSWELGATRGHRDAIAADEAGAIIAGRMQEAAQRRERLSLELDAGAYGRIRLDLVPPADAITTGAPALPPGVVRRARWLAAALQRQQDGASQVPLSASTRHAMERLAHLPECAALRNLRTVPAPLLPHVRSIARQLQEQIVR